MSIPVAHPGVTFGVLELVPLTVATLLYAKRASTLAARGRPVPVWRQACFASGLLVIGIALFSPIGHISEELVLVHMVEHLLIADIGALLLVLGLTGPLPAPVLSVPRAARAVAAGQGARLEERLLAGGGNERPGP